jgi:DNA-binding MarR family transcriptional regulator
METAGKIGITISDVEKFLDVKQTRAYAIVKEMLDADLIEIGDDSKHYVRRA